MKQLFHENPFWARLLFALTLIFAATFCHSQAQSNYPVSQITLQQAGTTEGTVNGAVYFNFVSGCTVTTSGATASITCSGGGSGTVSANSVAAGALTYYPSAAGSTTVNPDPVVGSNGSGTLTGLIATDYAGSTSGAQNFGCNPSTTCTSLGGAAIPLVVKSYGTGTNCSATGSAASPSLVACSSAAAGAFSCATNASGATCVISTTSVTANSEITVTQTAAESTRLGVSCNTSADTALTAPRVASKSAGTSFTINLGTFSTNPLCFDYVLTN